MSETDQLEIVMPDGQVRFYDLDPQRGVTNIGRHPENDVVVDSPSIAPFQAVLDHRQKPYHLVVLSEEGDVRVGDVRVPPNTPVPLKGWETLQLDGMSLVLVERDTSGVAGRPPRPAVTVAVVPEGSAARTSASVPVPRIAEVSTPTGAGSAPAPSPSAPTTGWGTTERAEKVNLGALPPDIPDDVILVQLAERAFTIDAGQSATWTLTLINGGPLVATMVVSVA
ncbi:MAG: FHA domain-containing protein, partial [Chloroflexi bacterium]